jgi:hypothetical protein
MTLASKILSLSLLIVLFVSCKEKITIITSTETGDNIEMFAAEELKVYLSFEKP